MNIIYYTEINMVCIILMLLINSQRDRQYRGSSTRGMILEGMFLATEALCVFDMVAGVCRGQTFTGAWTIIEISNLMFFEMLTVISFLWMLYVGLSLGKIDKMDTKKVLLLASPLIAFTVIALINPFTQIIFNIDENNLYVRNGGVYLHWIVTWTYFLIPTAQTALAVMKEKNKSRRRELAPLLYFIVAPVISSVLQMAFYGVSTTQVGITISVVMVFLTEQRSRIATDALTGLNNRRELDKYIAGCIQRHSEISLTIIMIDLNGFKQINDRLGHMTGDAVLQKVAAALRNSCDRAPIRIFLCRFGGDEFLMAARNASEEETLSVKQIIAEELEHVNLSENNPYSLSAAIGTASGICSGADDVERIIGAADASMYENKKMPGAARQ